MLKDKELTEQELEQAKQEAWNVNPKNPRVVFNAIVSEPLNTKKGLDKPIIVGLIIFYFSIIVVVVKEYPTGLVFLLCFGFIRLMNSLVNRNKSWKIFLGCIVISLLGLAFFVILKLNGV